MEVTTQRAGDALEVNIKGRLDAYWADHLSQTLDHAVRQGSHRIRLNLSEVPYISSAGIGVVVQFYKQLKEIYGWLVISEASPGVRNVLEIAKLAPLLLAEAPAEATTLMGLKLVGHLDAESPTYEVRDIQRGARFMCRVFGDPSLLRGCHFREQHARKMRFPDSTLAVGLGAFGDNFEDCSSRFGDFLAVAGAAAYQPSDGTNVADYLASAGDFVPEMMVLYGAACDGAFSHLVRFDPKAKARAASLSELVTTCLDVVGANAAGIAMVADSAGLIGAALRKSPAATASESAPFRHPEVREWLSFSAERAHPRALILVTGIAARGDCGALEPMLRPLAKNAGLKGHFHAAAFSYRPVKKGRIELKPTVASLFEASTLQGVLHLLTDDREIEGAGESEFVRGACWIGPIAEIKAG